MPAPIEGAFGLTERSEKAATPQGHRWEPELLLHLR
jgi:hypothetical protein